MCRWYMSWFLVLVLSSCTNGTVCKGHPKEAHSRKFASSTVLVATDNGRGFGCLISDRVVLTARHVVEDTEWILCAGIPAKVGKVAKSADIALLVLERASGAPSVKCAAMKSGRGRVYVPSGTMISPIPVLLDGTRHALGYKVSGITPIKGWSGCPVFQGEHIVGVITKLDFPNGGYVEGVQELFPQLLDGAK